MLKIFTLLIAALSFAFSVGFEYPYLYRDYRALGMGNAFNAVGGSFSSVFYNPAGLTNLKEEYGFYVNLLPVTASASTNIFGVADDFQRAISSGTDTEIINTIKKYRGEMIHAYLSLFPSIAIKRGKIAFGAGILVASKVNGILHHGGGSAGLYELESVGYGGPVIGFSYDRDEKITFGGSLKYLFAGGVNETFRISEVTAPDFNVSNYTKYGSDFAIDLGLIYKLPENNNMKPRIGVSLMNITNVYVRDVINIPMTANVGFALTSSRNEKFLSEWTLGVDYVDLFMAYKDKDILKRLRFGAEAVLVSGKAGSISVRGGLYGGQITAGVEFNIFIVTLAYTTYAEEIGARAFQEGSRRHLVYLNIGW